MGNITEMGLKNNVSVALQYLAAWLNGNGCVSINNLMEDMATAEIARSQIWQWLKHEKFDFDVFYKYLGESRTNLLNNVSDTYTSETVEAATDLLDDLVTSDKLDDFLTTKAYDILLENA